MSILYTCRRTVISALGIATLTFLGYTKGFDVTYAIMGICGAISMGNSAAESLKAKYAGKK